MHVSLRAVGSRVLGAECPCALVGVLGAAAVIPCIQVGIGHSLFQLVSYDRCHAVRSGVSVRTYRLSSASIYAASGVADERILDVAAADCSARVPAAILSTEAGAFSYVGRREHEIPG